MSAEYVDYSTFNHNNFTKLLKFYEENYQYVHWPKGEDIEVIIEEVTTEDDSDHEG